LAKNLKLNVKNAQLAEALKIGKIKKAPAASKKKQTEEIVPPVVEAVVEALIESKKEEVIEPETKKAPEFEKPLPPKTEASKSEAKTEERTKREEFSPPAPRTEPRQERTFARPSSPRPPYQTPQYPRQDNRQGQYTTRTTSGPGGYSGPRPAPRGDTRAPYPSSRPPYPPRKPMPPRGPLPPVKPNIPAKPSTKAEEPRKPGGFKEFRDLKPQKRETKTFDSRDRQGLRDSGDEAWRKRRPSQKMRSVQEEEVVIRPKNLSIRLPITVKDLAVAMKLKASQLISKLFMQGAVITLNDFLDDETVVQLLGHEFECEITIDRSEEERIRITDKTIKQEILETPESALILRPPVVTFMGHVDHGKTSLIDKIRKANMAADEAGAITQHIGAFKCHTAVGDLAILDTPGHEAFSAMRSRGADVTDIVVLVIAGDEGIRTQTLEAIEQARKALVPIVVALNKSDKPNFNAENIYRQLADQNLLPEAWGGTTITVNCSAFTGDGVKELLEMLALQAEILELKANPHTRARGTVIESEMHKGMGHVATLLVQNGTLRIGDSLVFAQHWARVKTMHDEYGKELSEAGPSTPVKITGLSGLPDAGSEFIGVKNEKEAQEVSRERTLDKKHALQQMPKRAALDAFQKNEEKQAKKTLSLILRADVQGSLDALKNSLMKIETKKVELNIISADVGEISESDIQLAYASKAPIIGFHTQIESHADRLIKETKVVVKTHDIIYHAIDDVKALMLGLLDKIAQENDTGTALVKATFKASQLGVIAGCQVTEGSIKRSNHIRQIRNQEVIWKGAISSLRKVKEDAREVSKGHECGIVLQNQNDVREGDILQAYEVTYLQQEL
jgi:translation initiation factor IF-2